MEINAVTTMTKADTREDMKVFFNNPLVLASVIAQKHDGLMKGAYYVKANTNEGIKGKARKVYLSNGHDFSINLNDLMGVGVSTSSLYPDNFNEVYHVFCYPMYDLFDAFGIKKSQKTIYFDLATGKGYPCSAEFYLANYGKRFLVTFENGDVMHLSSRDYGEKYVFLDRDGNLA